MDAFDWSGPRDKDIVRSDETKRRISESKKGAKNPRARKVFNTATGEVFETTTAAAASIGMRQNLLNLKLLGNRKNDTPFRYLNDDKRPGKV